MGSALGIAKVTADRLGLSLEEYRLRATGLKWCTACKEWHQVTAFNRDSSRGDGLATYCSKSRRTGRPLGWHEKPNINPLTGKPGPVPKPSRDGDKKQARARINHQVQNGLRPRPNTLPCSDCGHIWNGGPRHEYHHYLGYAAEHHFDVVTVCSLCHELHDSEKKAQMQCVHGHDFTAENTSIASNGTRHCKMCMKQWQRNRSPRGSDYWHAVNVKRSKKIGRRDKNTMG